MSLADWLIPGWPQGLQSQAILQNFPSLGRGNLEKSPLGHVFLNRKIPQIRGS